MQVCKALETRWVSTTLRSTRQCLLRQLLRCSALRV
jgi:hypothetical protein